MPAGAAGAAGPAGPAGAAGPAGPSDAYARFPNGPIAVPDALTTPQTKTGAIRAANLTSSG